MLKTNGFVDLRIGHGAAGIGDDSVWPSFTDIMTVIVMIFLMTLIVIMVRNFGLSSELLTNITAREAAMLANHDLAQKNTELEASLQSTETDRVSLSVSLAQALGRIASLSGERLELQADLQSITAAQKELEQANAQLQQTQVETSVKVEGLTADTESLARQKADLENALQIAAAERSSLAESLKQARERIDSLTGSERGLQDEVALLTAVRKELEQANAQLQQTQVETSAKVEGLTADTESLVLQKADLETALQIAAAERSSLVESLKQARERIASLTGSERGLQDELAKRTANELLLTRNIGSLDDTLAELEIESESQISSLIGERTTLEDRIYTLSKQLEHLRRLLSRSNLENQLLTEEMAQVERINEGAVERYTQVADQILSLKELIEQREIEIAALKASADTSAEEHRSLQEEYESLDVQYRKLVRPARSSVGKTVVEIRVEKVAGILSYKIKRPDEPELAPVSRSQLDSILQNLKNRLGKSLYTKIVIPDDSNLTFNEAWGFTWEILQRYDYYYQ